MVLRRRSRTPIAAAMLAVPLAFTAPAGADGEAASPRGNAVLWREGINGADVHGHGYTPRSARWLDRRDRPDDARGRRRDVERLDVHYAGAERLAFDVPDGVRQAVFRWCLTAPRNSWYWAIDSVSVRPTLPPADSADATSLWAVSDVQGHPHDLPHGMIDLARHARTPRPCSWWATS